LEAPPHPHPPVDAFLLPPDPLPDPPDPLPDPPDAEPYPEREKIPFPPPSKKANPTKIPVTKNSIKPP
jgi:hypothetical protein